MDIINTGKDEKGVVINIGGATEEDFNALTSIEHKLSRISSNIPSSEEILSYGTLCIYKVPEKHRNQNQEAYAPQLVSIGFVHHGEPQLQAMEECKLRYLKSFLLRYNVGLGPLLEYVKSEAELVYGCYEDIYVQKVLQKCKDPCEVILLDGIFIVELFLKKYFREAEEKDDKELDNSMVSNEKGDKVLDNSMVSNEIVHDLLLFENQLPFRFLYQLYDKFLHPETHGTMRTPSFDELVRKYFGNVGNTGELKFGRDFKDVRHFVEFLSVLHDPPYVQNDVETMFLKNGNCPPTLERQFHKKEFRQCPTAAELRAVGVVFKKATDDFHLHIEFDNKTGVLTIAPLTVNRFTETFFRNSIAFEQSEYDSRTVTSFVMFLDNLIDSAKDVDVLMKSGIIQNELPSSKLVADLFDTLYKEFPDGEMEFYYANECKELNEYSRHWWHKLKAEMGTWIVTMWRNYFSTPWSICSLIAAITVLALTAIQTAYAIKAYNRGF